MRAVRRHRYRTSLYQALIARAASAAGTAKFGEQLSQVATLYHDASGGFESKVHS